MHGAIAAWRYRSHPETPRPGEDERFARTLGEALRLGHALGADLELALGSGATGGLTVTPRDPTSARWWATSVLPVYPITTWTARPPGGPGPPARWLAAPRRGTDAPYRSAELVPWTDPLARALRDVPSGWSVRVRLRAAGRWDGPADERPAIVPRPLGYALVAPPARPGPVREREDRRARRLGEPRWHAEIGIHGRGSDVVGRRVLRLVEGASEADGGNGFAFRRTAWWRRALLPGLLLSQGELLGLLPNPWSPWSDDEPSYSAGPRWSLGRDPGGWPVELSVEAGNGHHLLILGETGMGKSTLLAGLAAGAAELGAVVLLDPIGDTARAAARRLAAAPSAKPVSFIAPSRPGGGINALRAVAPTPPSERELGDLLDALRRVRSARFAAAPFWGPRIEETALAALTAAAARPGGTLVDAVHVLQDPAATRDPEGSKDGQEALRGLRALARERPEELDGARRVLREATRTEPLRRLLSDPRPVTKVSDALAPGRITIVSGDAPAVGEPTARTLLSLYLALLWSALVAVGGRGPVFLLLEEAPWYANDSLAQMFRLGRRWGLHVAVVAQSMEAFPPDLREALLTNAADQVRFRGPPEEGREHLPGGLGPDTARWRSLPRGMAAVVLGKGRAFRWLRVDPPTPEPGPTGTDDRRTGAAGPPDPRSGVPEGPAGEETAWQDLRARCPADGSLRLHVSEWRRSLDLPEATVRAIGRQLAARGALRSRRGPDGAVWEIDGSALRGGVRGGPDGGDPERIEEGY